MSTSYSPPQRSYSPDPSPDTIPLSQNYPTPSRKDTMFLSTIGANDFPLKKFKQFDTNRDWSINLYNLDIEGSSPRRFGALNQKIDFTNKNDDIERSWPKQLHVGLNKPEYNLRNDDIEKSKPGCIELKSTRNTNPLEPKYNLPHCENYPFEIPRFIRDNIDVKDIEGAQPTKKISLEIKRDPLKKDDIQGTSPRRRYNIRNKGNYEYIDYRDVYKEQYIRDIKEPSDKSKIRNPLDPMYYLGFINGDKETHGPIEKNKPCVYSKFYYDPSFALRTDDILGTNPGSKNYINKFTGMNYIYNTKDIPGAQTSTLKKGIVTQRRVNPLRPKYNYLGAEEIKQSIEKTKSLNRNGANTTIPGKRITLLNKGNNNLTQRNNGTFVSHKSSLSQTQFPNTVTNSPRNSKEINNIDFGTMPFVDDTVKFDHEKYKKPNPFYGFIHDKNIIPPIEQLKRKEPPVNPNLKSFQESVLEKTNNKGLTNSLASSLFPKQSYAQKLDDFMVRSNLKYIENQNSENKKENANNVNQENENQNVASG